MTIIPAPKKAKTVKKKSAATKKAAPKKPVKKAAAKTAAKPAAKKLAKKSVAKKKAPVKKAVVKKAAAKKIVVKKAVAKKTVAKKVVAPKKAAVKKAVAKKPAAKKVAAPKAAAPKVVAPKKSAQKPKGPLSPVEQLLAQVTQILEDGKAEDIVAIDMTGKSAIADYMVVATGRSQRQLAALAEHLRAQLKLGGRRMPQPEGLGQGDWVLLDAGDVIVHLFRPEVRGEYNLEKMWSQPFGAEPSGMEGLVKDHAVPTPHTERMVEQQIKTFRPDFRNRNKPRRR